MKSNTHPTYQALAVHCQCGNTFLTMIVIVNNPFTRR